MQDLFSFLVYEDASDGSWVRDMLERKENFLGSQEDRAPILSLLLEDLGQVT